MSGNPFQYWFNNILQWQQHCWRQLHTNGIHKKYFSIILYDTIFIIFSFPLQWQNGGLGSAEVDCKFHIFTIETSGPELQDLDDKDEEVAAATHWQLPAQEFHGLWDTLIYDCDVKMQLLNFVQTTLMFSDRGVNSNIISWNRFIE